MWSHQEDVCVVHVLVEDASADDQVLEHESLSKPHLFLLPRLSLCCSLIFVCVRVNSTFFGIESITSENNSFEHIHFGCSSNQHGVASSDESIELLHMLSSGWLGEQSSTVGEVGLGIFQSNKEILNGFNLFISSLEECGSNVINGFDFFDEWEEGFLQLFFRLGNSLFGSFGLSLGSSLDDAVNTKGEDGWEHCAVGRIIPDIFSFLYFLFHLLQVLLGFQLSFGRQTFNCTFHVKNLSDSFLEFVSDFFDSLFGNSDSQLPIFQNNFPGVFDVLVDSVAKFIEGLHPVFDINGLLSDQHCHGLNFLHRSIHFVSRSI